MKNPNVVAYILGAFLVFTAGYFIVHGREAHASGSWDVVITSPDEFIYWAVAKGASQTPMSDENPFYYEEMGKRMSLPWTTALLTGKLAKWLNLSVMNFFPLWHIGMPFVLWLSLFLCLWKIWQNPPGASAALAMLFLLSTLFFRGRTQYLLFRFSRPGDGLWLIFFWLSLVMNPEKNFKFRTLTLCLLTFVAFWLQPYYVLIGMVAVFFETCFSFSKPDDKSYRANILVMFSIIPAAFSYWLYFKGHGAYHSWLAVDLTHRVVTQLKLHILSLVLFASICAFVLLPPLLTKKKVTPVGRLTLYVFFTQPLLANLAFLSRWFSINSEIFYHLYYFFPIQIACLTGVMLEYIPQLLSKPLTRKATDFFAWGALACLGVFLLRKQTYFLLYTPQIFKFSKSIGMGDLDSSFRLICASMMLFFVVWAYCRFQTLKKIFLSKKFAVASIVLLSLMGYSLIPNFMHTENRDYPFLGAARWFREHAVKNEVVLTVPPRRMKRDYLVLLTDLKTFFMKAPECDYEKNRKFRKLFYETLLLGGLKQVPFDGYRTIEEKLKHLKLDYVLIDKPSIFLEIIRGQLGDFLIKVYEDKRSIIWKVRV